MTENATFSSPIHHSILAFLFVLCCFSLASRTSLQAIRPRAGTRYRVHAACSTGVNSHSLGSSQRVEYFGLLPSHTQLLRWPQLVFKGADF